MRLQKEKGRGSGDAAVDVRCGGGVWGCVGSRLAWKKILGVSTFYFPSYSSARVHELSFLFSEDEEFCLHELSWSWGR